MRLINLPTLDSKVGLESKVQDNSVRIQTTEGTRVTELSTNLNPEMLGHVIVQIILEAQRIGYINAQKDMRKSLGDFRVEH